MTDTTAHIADETAQAGVPSPATADGLEEERRTSPLELLWDLVFVFAVTQVTTLLTNDLSAAGFGRSMLVLARPVVDVLRPVRSGGRGATGGAR